MACRILALLLLAMAVGQMSDLVGFVDIIETYEIGGRLVAWLLASSLMIGEVAAGVGLLVPHRTPRAVASAIGVGVAIAWSALAIQAFARGLALDNCGCFGVHLGQQLRWWILLEDAEFVALAAWVHRSCRRQRRERTGDLARSRPGVGRRTTT